MMLKEPDHTCLTYYHTRDENQDQDREDKLARKENNKKSAADRAIKNLVEANMLSRARLSHKKVGVEGK